jgi:hypothetical protein
MTEKRKSAPAFEEERPSKGAAKRRRSPWRIVALVLLLVLIGGTAYLLYNGSLYQAAIQALTAENARQKQSIQDLTADNAAKDEQILALGAESAEKDRQLGELDAEAAEKDAALRDLGAENEEKAQQLQGLTAELAAANAPLDYQAAIREAAPAAALQALELPAELEQSEEMKASLLAALFRTAYLEADPANSREDHLSFTVHAADGQLLGSVSFELAGDQAGQPLWTTAEEQFDFSKCFKTTTVTVPPDYRVYLGDRLLGEEWIREVSVPYASLAYCAEDFDDLPTLVRYETPPFLGEPDLHILDGQGKELPADAVREEVFLDQCPEEAREKIEAYLPDFVELYVRFSADIKDSARVYYNRLVPIVKPDSPLALRMKAAFEGLGYSAARAVELESVTVNSITDLGGGRYAVDLNYLTMVTGHSSAFAPVEDELRLLLILSETEDGQILAEALYYL